MIDEHVVALINGDIDGVLSASERAELREILASSTEVQEYYQGLEQLDGLLQDVPAQEYKMNFDQRFGDLFPRGASVTPIRKTGMGRLSNVMSYGLATAAGILLAVGYYESRKLDSDEQDFGQMLGTMAPDTNRMVAAEAFKVNEAGVQSEARLEERHGKLVLEITVDSARDTDISVDFSATSLRFNAMAQFASQFESIQIDANVIRLRSNGQQHFTMLLDRATNDEPGDPGVVRLRYSRDGALIQQGTLAVR
ncbi:MAG: hypothetical protein HKN70_02730 [Gammaproteobacteria bacterium]|nr:hypothetical protein [Gammaproteobacteria bacterium]